MLIDNCLKLRDTFYALFGVFTSLYIEFFSLYVHVNQTAYDAAKKTENKVIWI